MSKSAERVARNDAVFRSANEKIREAAEGFAPDDSIPFVCECAEPACHELVRITLPEYTAIRDNPRWFLNAPGHHVSADGWAAVVEDHGHYVVAEKVGKAGEIVEQLDGSEHPESEPIGVEE